MKNRFLLPLELIFFIFDLKNNCIKFCKEDVFARKIFVSKLLKDNEGLNILPNSIIMKNMACLMVVFDD